MARNPNFECEVCNRKVYRNPNNPPKNVTCSKECRSILNKKINGQYIKCDNCGKVFYKKNSRISNNNFCDLNCANQFRKPTLSKKEIINMHKEGLYDKEIANKADCSRVYITKLLNDSGYINRHDKKKDKNLRNRIRQTLKGTRTGNDNHNFKGKANYTDKARGLFISISKEYMESKNYTCEICNKKGGNLNTHHVKPFYKILDDFLSKYKNINPNNFSKKILEYPDFIRKDNLVLVCEDCHNKIHYGDNPELSPFRWESATTIENQLG